MQYWGNPVANTNMEFVRCRTKLYFLCRTFQINFTGT